MKRQYYAGAVSALSLSLLLIGASANAAPITMKEVTGVADAGVINEQQILYWLVKRGELASDAKIGRAHV